MTPNRILSPAIPCTILAFTSSCAHSAVGSAEIIPTTPKAIQYPPYSVKREPEYESPRSTERIPAIHCVKPP